MKSSIKLGKSNKEVKIIKNKGSEIDSTRNIENLNLDIFKNIGIHQRRDLDNL